MARLQVKDAFDLQIGKTPSRKKLDYWTEGTFDWVSIRDLGTYDRYVGSTREHITQLAVDESGIKPVPPNTLIMSFKLSLGKTAITVEPTYTNEAIMAFIDKGTYPVDLGYMFHQLRTKDWTEGTNRAVMGATLNKKSLSESWILLPSENEQQEAANVLDSVIEKLARVRMFQAKFDQLAKSRFVEMFGDLLTDEKRWPIDELGNHIDILAGYPFDSSQFTEVGIKICGGLIIAPHRIVWAESKHWRSAQGFEQYVLMPGDIVVALDRPWISEGFKIASIAESDPQSLLIQRTARIRGLDFEQAFIMHLLDSDAFKSHCTITGSLVPHISHKSIKSFRVPVPPRSLQQEFAAFVQQVDKLKLITQQQIEKLQMLYDSLAQEYFSI